MRIVRSLMRCCIHYYTGSVAMVMCCVISFPKYGAYVGCNN
jgi:hypothetical protein